MFTQLPFFILLMLVSSGFLLYKLVVRQFQLPPQSWWHYRYTAVLLSIVCWAFIYQDNWRGPLALFVLDYSLFMLSRRGVIRRWWAVLLTLAPLIALKTYHFPMPAILGLSFITFRALDALLMSTAEDSADIGEYFLYLFFPPAILAGPMYRWHDFRQDLAGAFERLTVPTVLEGWEHLLLGIVQKFAVAQLLDICVLQRLDTMDYSLSSMAMNAIGYSAFLYFDFAGYSNIAIGAAGLFGFRLPPNFRNPIATRNPQDFWRRWHVSLSEWLRDVVFAPLYKFLVSKGGLAGRRREAQNICIMATLMIMGTWNGLEPQYVASGTLFGLYSVAYNEIGQAKRDNAALKILFEKPVVRDAGRVLTLVLEILALYVFSGRSPIH